MSILLEIVDDVSSLALVRRDDSYLLGLDTCPLQIENNLIDSGGFGPVQIRSSRCRQLFSSIKIQEEARLAIGPWKLLIDLSILFSDAVLQSPIVKSIGREIGKTRMHPILHL